MHVVWGSHPARRWQNAQVSHQNSSWTAIDHLRGLERGYDRAWSERHVGNYPRSRLTSRGGRRSTICTPRRCYGTPLWLRTGSKWDVVVEVLLLAAGQRLGSVAKRGIPARKACPVLGRHPHQAQSRRFPPPGISRPACLAHGHTCSGAMNCAHGLVREELNVRCFIGLVYFLGVGVIVDGLGRWVVCKCKCSSPWGLLSAFSNGIRVLLSCHRISDRCFLEKLGLFLSLS